MSVRSAFSMIELIVVITVIGILAAMVVPRFVSAQSESSVAATAQDLRALSNALAMYHAEHNQYPRDVYPQVLIGVLSPYFKSENPFEKGVPIGGVYDYEGPPNWSPVQISIRQSGNSRYSDVDASALDEYMDDGNPETGAIRLDTRSGERIAYYFLGE